MNNKIKITSILVDRAEGPTDLCRPRTFNTFASANAYIREIATTAPKGGAYDKTDFAISYADGETYRGRLDVHHETYEKCESIEEHTTYFCRFYGGLMTADDLPPWVSRMEYERFLAQYSADEKLEKVKFLENYQLGD